MAISRSLPVFFEKHPYSEIMGGDYDVREIVVQEKECAIVFKVHEETGPEVIEGCIVRAGHYEFGDMSFDSLSNVIEGNTVKVTGDYNELRMFLHYLEYNRHISKETLESVLLVFDQIHHCDNNAPAAPALVVREKQEPLIKEQSVVKTPEKEHPVNTSAAFIQHLQLGKFLGGNGHKRKNGAIEEDNKGEVNGASKQARLL